MIKLAQITCLTVKTQKSLFSIKMFCDLSWFLIYLQKSMSSKVIYLQKNFLLVWQYFDVVILLKLQQSGFSKISVWKNVPVFRYVEIYWLRWFIHLSYVRFAIPTQSIFKAVGNHRNIWNLDVNSSFCS